MSPFHHTSGDLWQGVHKLRLSFAKQLPIGKNSRSTIKCLAVRCQHRSGCRTGKDWYTVRQPREFDQRMTSAPFSCARSDAAMLGDTTTGLANAAQRAVAALVAIDPAIRVMIGTIHAALDHEAFTSANPAIWIWTTNNRFPPTLFHEANLEQSLEKAHCFLHTAGQRPFANKRAADEAEGGFIIPDYMY